MKVKIVDKPKNSHVNPTLLMGHVYQNLDSKEFYFSGCTSHGLVKHIVLFQISSGTRWNDEGGFGNGRFKDVTSDATFVVEV